MKLILAVAAMAALSTAAFAKEVTLTGEGKCMKCALKKADKCQNVVEVKDGDKWHVILDDEDGEITFTGATVQEAVEKAIEKLVRSLSNIGH